MAEDLPADDLDDARAALASTLEATAAILPWLAKPHTPRFNPKLNTRWIEACGQLDAVWSNRHTEGAAAIRPAIFTLYGIALETLDADLLLLGEALAGAADHCENELPSSRLTAALSATIESLHDAEGLEHKAVAERARHFAQRLEASCRPASDNERSAVLDRIFVGEAREHLSLMHEALARLPLDAYALKTEAVELAGKAELLELFGIMQQARTLAGLMDEPIAEVDGEQSRLRIESELVQLAAALAAVNG